MKVDTRKLVPGGEIFLEVGGGDRIKAGNDLTPAELEIIRYGGLLNQVRERKKGNA